ncbi:hypothetical protein BG004_000491 [Podila humilis]|nr:hypothetical protein BG004_000491 [Podila humilis]
MEADALLVALDEEDEAVAKLMGELVDAECVGSTDSKLCVEKIQVLQVVDLHLCTHLDKPRAFQTSSAQDLELIDALEPSDPARFNPYNGSLLAPFMIPRVSGTPNNTIVQDFIIDYFAKLNQTSSNLGAEHEEIVGFAQPHKHDSPKLKKRKTKLREHHDKFEKRAAGTTGTGWHLEVDRFEDNTPYGVRNFTNLVLTKNPNAENRLVFAAHFDSKYFPPTDKPKEEWNGGLDTLPFIAATDSAVPCAILLDLAASLDSLLDNPSRTDKDTTLQLVFFDGEEAFEHWTSTDSLYGSRHLAELWEKRKVRRTRTATGRNGGSTANNLEGIELFVLLDLLGAEAPTIPSYFSSTHWAYRLAESIETRLWDAGLDGKSKAEDEDGNDDDEDMDKLEDPKPLESFFQGEYRWGAMQDDHIPFIERGVPVFHVIPVPFPEVWHHLEDDASAVSQEVIVRWANIFRTFAIEYLSLLQPRQHKRDEL